MELMYVNDPTVHLDVSGTTDNIQMPGAEDGEGIIFTNLFAFPIYVKLGGDDTVVATVDNTCIPPGCQVSYKRKKEQTYCAAITDGLEGTLTIQYGNGK